MQFGRSCEPTTGIFDYLSVVVICHVVGTLHGVGHLSVSRRLSVNVTHVKLHEAGTSCVCTPSTNKPVVETV